MPDIDVKAMVEGLIPLVISYGMRILGVLFLLWVSVRIANTLQDRLTALLKRRKFDTTLSIFFGTLVKWTVMVAAGLACLSIFGIETTSFAAIIGAAGLAIGLAFQGTLANFASGVLILTFRPFKVGDVVGVAGQKGTITEISLFTCSLDTFDKRRFIIPNKMVMDAVIENVSHHEVRRFTVDVGVDYSASIPATRAALTRAAESVSKREISVPYGIFLDKLADSSVTWQVRIWAKAPDYWAAYEEAVEAVKRELTAEGISIPFPQMDVHLDGSLGKEA